MKPHKFLLSLVYFLFLLLLFSSCSAMFQEKLGMKDSNSSLGDLSKNPNLPIELVKPAQVFVSRGDDVSEITVNWTAVKGASFYNVYRADVPVDVSAEPAEDDYNLIQQVYGTLYVDTIPDNSSPLDYKSEEYSKNYFYKIEAENELSGVEPGPKSDAVSGFLLAPPRTLLAETGASTTSITVRWDKVPGAAKYEVWRTDNPNGTDGLASRGFVTGNQFINEIREAEQGKEFYYVVEAVNTNGTKSYRSPLAMGFSLQAGAPEKIIGVTADKAVSGTEINVLWKAVVMDQASTKYTVYRNSSNSSQYVMLAKDLAGSIETFKDTTKNKDTKNLEPNVEYYYYIQAIKDTGETDSDGKPILLKSSFSDKTVNAAGYLLSPPPADPSSLYALAKPQGTEIYWSVPIGTTAEQAAYTYSVRYSPVDSSNPAFFTELPLSYESLGQGKFKAFDTNKSGFYTIVTRYNGAESKMSAVVEPSPGPVIELNYEKMSENPGKNGVYPIKLSWQKPDDVAVKYKVYRSTAPDTGFKQVTAAAISDLSWTDETNESAVPSRFYYYKIQAVNSLDQGLFTDNSKVAETYGYLTAKAFYAEYEKTILSSQKKLTYMNRPGSTDKLGTETKNGKTGTVYYSANLAGLGARIIIKYTDYSDFVNSKDEAIMTLNGNSNTSANMSSNGTMDGTITAKGMYAGTVKYDNIEIKAGAAGGGYYLVKPEGFAESKINHRGEPIQ